MKRSIFLFVTLLISGLFLFTSCDKEEEEEMGTICEIEKFKIIEEYPDSQPSYADVIDTVTVTIRDANREDLERRAEMNSKRLRKDKEVDCGNSGMKKWWKCGTDFDNFAGDEGPLRVISCN